MRFVEVKSGGKGFFNIEICKSKIRKKQKGFGILFFIRMKEKLMMYLSGCYQKKILEGAKCRFMIKREKFILCEIGCNQAFAKVNPISFFIPCETFSPRNVVPIKYSINTPFIKS